TSRSDSPRYFVVVGSFIDSDLAKDYSDRLNERENSTFLIHPYGNGHFYRLSVGYFENWDSAVKEMESLRSSFEENLWVLKY
ncbi:MAG: SPOR domain-containing protein, partial [Cyclobacteriaceae bacterium]